MRPANPPRSFTERPSSVDALTAAYGERMREVKAPSDLHERVLERACAANASWSAPAKGRPRRLVRFALAACLAAAAGIGAFAALGSIATDERPLSFVLKAYGNDEKLLAPDGARGMVVFDSAMVTQGGASPAGEDYETQGLYTGCEFHVEGDDVVRIQAHMDRGEFYQVETVAYTPTDAPELAKALSSWKPGLRYYDELTARYDRIERVIYDKAVHEANEGRIKGDPDTLSKTNLYQRLGETIDFDQTSESTAPRADGTPLPLTERTFGLWTNLPFEALTHEEALAAGDDLTTVGDRNREAALETLDGARLTVTVTFADGSHATQTIELHTADFKAEAIARANGSAVLQTAPTMLRGTADELPRASSNTKVGDIVSVRTIYGLVTEETSEPFPHGTATRESLDSPRTPVEFLFEEATERTDAETLQQKNASLLQDEPCSPLAYEDLLEGSASYRTSVRHTDNNATSESGQVTIEGAEVVEGLPSEIDALTDMFAYYANGGYYDDDLDAIVNERQGYAIAADGTLSPGFSYVVVTQIISNDGFHPAEIALCSGQFYGVEEDPANPDALRMRRLCTEESPLWRSGHDGPGWDTSFMFQVLQPGEEQTIRLLYVLPDTVLHDERLGYYYHDPELAPRERVLHLGALL